MNSIVSDSDINDSIYPSLLLGPTTIYNKAKSEDTIQNAVNVLNILEKDAYSKFLVKFYSEGLEKFGTGWEYCDLLTGLIAAATLSNPEKYLEIGVRRGRSMCSVASCCPNIDIYAFDMWVNNYAGVSNPGPDFVERELSKFNYQGNINFIDGDSHHTLPVFFSNNPKIKFDLITVDGDHSKNGALMDLRQVLPYLKVGGIILFDDICHQSHPYLIEVWERAIREDGGILTYEYSELGYGLAIGVRFQNRRQTNKLIRLFK